MTTPRSVGSINTMLKDNILIVTTNYESNNDQDNITFYTFPTGGTRYGKGDCSDDNQPQGCGKCTKKTDKIHVSIPLLALGLFDYTLNI